MSEAAFLEELAQPYRELGINMEEHHLPVPHDHSPPLQTIVSNAWDGIVLKESWSGAIIHCENPVDVVEWV